MKIQVFSSTAVNWEITTSWMHPGENMSLVRFIFSPPPPPPSLFFAKSHWKPGRTGISFAIIRAQFTRGNLETVFFTGRSRVIISLFCILLASSIVAADRMDERNVRGRRIFVTCPMIYTRNRDFNGDLGIFHLG